MGVLRVAGLLCALALCGAGCGSSSEAAETVERFKDAVAEGDLRAACDELTEAAQSRFFHGECRLPDATEISSPVEFLQEADDSAYSVVNLAGERKIDDGPGVDEQLDERAVDAVTEAHALLQSYFDVEGGYAGATPAALVELARELREGSVELLETANFSTFETTARSLEIGVTSLSGTEFRIVQEPEASARADAAFPSVETRECEPVGGRCPSSGDFLSGEFESAKLEVP